MLLIHAIFILSERFKSMLFSPGPTEIEPYIRDIGMQPMPYFRGEDFLDLILELTEDMRYLFGTSQTPLFVTASGSGVMEMAIQNLTDAGDRVLVLNGGTFGAKWTNMCRAHGLDTTEIQIGYGKNPDLGQIESGLRKGVKVLFATAHETSTGYLFDIQKLGELAKTHECLLVVDAVSSIGADEFKMDEWHCDCSFVSSQKALACMPGLSVIAFSDAALQRISRTNRHRYYFDAQEYLVNATRGMIPYTPAINVCLQLMERMRLIRGEGMDNYILRHATKARIFRQAILSQSDFSLFPESSSNSMSAIGLPQGCSMSAVIEWIVEKYGWILAPNPTRDESYIRVSHMGDLSQENLLLMAQRIQEACRYSSVINNG